MADTNVSPQETDAGPIEDWSDPDEVFRRFRKAVADAIADHRQHGRPIVVDRGNGVEVIP